MVFGDGSDGDVVISVNTTLTRDMNYNNLTIDAGVTLYPDGYIIYVKDTLTVDGSISRNGKNAGIPLWNLGGAALPTRRVGGSGKGGDSPGTRDADDGESVSGIACSEGGRGGPGDYPYYARGEGGITSPCHTVVCTNLNDIIVNALSRLGGPGGGGGGDKFGNPGGGGGSGGGVIYCSAKYIIINATGMIKSVGGNGYNRSRQGGGGGGGGCIAIVSSSMTNNGTIDVGGGIGGDGGSSGTSGIIIYCIAAAATAINPGRPLHHSTGATVSGGTGCGMGKRRR